MSRLIIRFGKISDSNALRTMLSPYPFSVRQVDSDSRSRILITTKHSRTHHIGSDASHLLLAKTCIDRRMVFKPLRIVTDSTCTLGSIYIFIFYDALPRALEPQRVTIDFNKSIDEIDKTILLRYPFYRVTVKGRQITIPVVGYKQ